MDTVRKLLLLALITCNIAQAQTTDPLSTAADLIELDFEELVNMDVEVQSAGKSNTRALELPYAAYVISAGDIASSGAQTIPDALRLAPGVTVSQISTAEWSVAIRGQGGRFSRYVLVMVDGRSAYNLVFSGVNWDELNLTLSDIDRIEVIRGPNAASWGANAVNGIINIITRRADEKPGSRISAWGGVEERAGISASTSHALAAGWTMGLSGHTQQWAGLESEDGNYKEDKHTDWRLSADFSYKGKYNNFRLTGSTFESKQSPYWSWLVPELGMDIIEETHEQKKGWVIQGQLNYTLSEDTFFKVRASSEKTDRNTELYIWNSNNYQVDAEISSNKGSHQLSAGVNTRFNKALLLSDPGFPLYIKTPRSSNDSYGFFASDIIDINEALELTLAARIDNDDLIDSELQPSIRLLWRPSDSNRVWLAASKASSTPSVALMELDEAPYGLIPAAPTELPLPVIISLSGSEEQKSTRVRALELGYRHTFGKLNIDFSIFDFLYSDSLNIVELGDPSIVFDNTYRPQYLLQHTGFENNKEFSTIGSEVSIHMQPLAAWNSQLNFSILETDDLAANTSANLSFSNQIELNESLHWNIWLRYSYNNKFASAQFSDIDNPYGEPEDKFIVVDSNIQWQTSEKIQLSLSVKNLGSSHTEAVREEFSSPIMLIEPSAIFKVSVDL